MTVKKGAYMYIKWMVPDYGMRGILNGIGRFLFGENDEVHYIGGAGGAAAAAGCRGGERVHPDACHRCGGGGAEKTD